MGEELVTWHRIACSNSACPEVGLSADEILVRSSTTPSVVVRFSRAEWDAFVAGVKRGDVDGVSTRA